MTVYSIFAIIGAVALMLTALRSVVARPSNWLVCYLQNFVGALFIFSGFVKAVDPMGTGFKMHEYFEAFAQEGLRPFWESLGSYSTLMAIFMIALELFVGFMLLIGWQPRLTVAVVWWLTLFFTLLTGYTYLSGYGITPAFMLSATAIAVLLGAVAAFKNKTTRKRLMWASAAGILLMYVIGKFTGLFFTSAFVETGMKVTDCGCFGDFMKLKPWETFYKDVVLDVMIFLLVIGTDYIKKVFNAKETGFLAAGSAVASAILCLYNVYWNEPLIDFRPYAVGQNIIENRKTPKLPKIEMLFNYKNKKTGEVKGYKTEELSGLNFEELEFVDRSEKVLDPGIPAKISNLLVEDEEGADVTEQLFSEPGFTFIALSWDLKNTYAPAFERFKQIARLSQSGGAKFVAITVNDGGLEAFRKSQGADFPFYHADATPLKTMMRSNPGLMLIKGGVVVKKWHYRHFPQDDEVNKLIGKP